MAFNKIELSIFITYYYTMRVAIEGLVMKVSPALQTCPSAHSIPVSCPYVLVKLEVLGQVSQLTQTRIGPLHSGAGRSHFLCC